MTCKKKYQKYSVSLVSMKFLELFDTFWVFSIAVLYDAIFFYLYNSSSSKSQEKTKKGSPTPSSSSLDYKMAGKDFLQPNFPALNSQQRLSDTKTRNKVALKQGRSLMDWIRLGRSGEDLTGVGGKMLEVDAEELAKHNHRNDAWIALRGN